MPKILTKRVSNYELFFDLAFVLAISRLTATIHLEHVGLQELFAFFVTHLILLSLWGNEAFYFNKYGDARRIDIFTIIPLMFIIGNLALNFNFDWQKVYQGSQNVVVFNSLLIIAYLLIALQYYLKGRALGFNEDQKANIRVLLLYAASLLPFVFGILPVNIYTILIYFLPIIFPFFVRSSIDTTRINFPHLLERMQLLTILTFGEAVIGIIQTYSAMPYILSGFFFFVGMSLLFMFYMSQTFLNIDHHHNRAGMLLFYAHSPIILGIILFTVAIEFLVDAHHIHLGFGLFVASLLLFYIGVLATSYYNYRHYQLNKKVLGQFTGLLMGASLLFYLTQEHLLLLSMVFVVLTWLMNRTNMLYRRSARERHNIPHPDPKQNPRDFS